MKTVNEKVGNRPCHFFFFYTNAYIPYILVNVEYTCHYIPYISVNAGNTSPYITYISVNARYTCHYIAYISVNAIMSVLLTVLTATTTAAVRIT